MNLETVLDFSVKYANIVAASVLALVSIYAVFVSKSRNKQEFVLGILSFVIGLWTVDLYFVDQQIGYEVNLLLNQFSFVLPLFVLLLISDLFINILRSNKPKRQEKVFLYAMGIAYVILTFVILFTDTVVTKIVWEETFYNVLKGPGYTLYLGLVGLGALAFLIYFIGTTLFGLWQDGMEIVAKVKARYFGLITGIAMVFVLFTNVVLPVLTGSSKYTQLVPLILVFWCIGVLFLISKFRLFDLGFMVRWVFFVVLGAAISTTVLYLLYIGLSQITSTFTIIAVLAVLSILGIIVAIVFQKYVAELIDFILYLGRDNPVKSSIELSNSIATVMDPNKLAKTLYEKITGLVGVHEMAIVIFDPQVTERDKRIVFSFVKNIRLNKNDLQKFISAVRYWESVETDDMLIDYEVKEKLSRVGEKASKALTQIAGLMTKHNIAVMLPLNRKIQLQGVVILGAKDNNVPYMGNELQIFDEFVKISSVAFGRAILYYKVEAFNRDLKKKVDAATEEIRDKMQKMQEMRRRERDMLDIMGHELRTPLAIIKNAASMIDYFEEKKMATLKPVVKDQFKNIKEAMNREINLVETMLAATKIDANKIELNIDTVDLNEVIRQTELAFAKAAEEKGLKLTFEFDKRKKWLAFGDKLRIQEIFDNLISNAIKYTNEGWVKLSLREKEFHVEVTVEDSGVGISAEDLRNLGKKFFRANPYVENGNGNGDGNGKSKHTGKGVVRPGGTGLGLYVTFGLIKAMGGKIRVESEFGKGSKFVFTLPKG